MKVRNYAYCFFIGMLFLLLLGACIDLISLNISDENLQKIVIQAKIQKGTPSIIEVEVSKSAGSIEFFNAQKISDAKVKVIDQTQRSISIPKADFGSYFLLWTNNREFEIIRGNSYQLEVQLPNGELYQSNFEKIYGVPEALRLDVELETKNVLNEVGTIISQDFMQIFVGTPLRHPDEAENAYLKWDMEGVFLLREVPPPFPGPDPKSCYISEALRLDKVHVFNGLEATFTSNNIERLMIYEEPVSWHYSLGYYLTIYQQSLSKGAYKYWNSVKQVAEREGSLFETPPGKINSNIYNINNSSEEVLGYFYVTEIDTIRRLIKPEDVNYPSQICTPFLGEEKYATAPDYCKNCLLWPNSSTQKPYYWIE